MVRIVYICNQTVLLKDLSTRVHSFNENKYKNAPKKGDLEDTEATGYCGSSNVEPGGGDVAFGEAEEDAPWFKDECGRPRVVITIKSQT